MSSPLQDLVALAQEPSSARRRELLRRVTDLFLAPDGPAERSAGEVQAFDAVFCALAGEMEGGVRIALARRFAAAGEAPARMAALLARDAIEAALPILADARLLCEADLVEVARTQGQAHLRAVSARPDVTEAVSELIVERGDDQTVSVLVRNDRAALSRRSSERVVARAQANPALQAAVIERRAMPLDLVNELYFAVEAELRARIAARNAAADPQALEAALRAARTRLLSRAAPADEGLERAQAEVARLDARRRLTPPALLAWLRAGERDLFTAGLARLAELDAASLAAVLARADLDALAVVCKSADLDKAMYLTFAVLLSDGREALARAAGYGQLYAALPRDTALRTLRFWRVRQGEVAAA